MFSNLSMWLTNEFEESKSATNLLVDTILCGKKEEVTNDISLMENCIYYV